MILDTNAVSALLAGDEALAELLGDSRRHELPVVVLGEYRYGLKRSRHRAALEPLLDALASACTVLAIDDTTATSYAEVREQLRAAGRPIPENDVWIAALARQHGVAIVSRDQHFDLVEGVVRLAW